MKAGLILTDNETEASSIAFLDDNSTDTFSIKDTGELVDLIVEKSPNVLAINCGTELSGKEYTKGEEELKEEGFNFTPSSNEKKKVERARAIERSLKHHMDDFPEIIRFDPFISAKELAIDGDKALESLGVETEDISSSKEFDSVLGAITAQFYAENHYSESDIVVPEKV